MFWLFLILTLLAAVLTWRWVQLGQRQLTTFAMILTLGLLLITVGLRLPDFGRGFFTALGTISLVAAVIVGFRHDRYRGW
ncbi:MAG: hypothetical protein IMX01_03605 [Limnochordaceae bacterium]|nr:hypothetical protein [Limnochordaceae bacterium]